MNILNVENVSKTYMAKIVLKGVSVGGAQVSEKHAGFIVNTGNATTEHVHFETRIGGTAFDSELIFDHKKHELRDVKLTAKKKNGNIDIKVK